MDAKRRPVLDQRIYDDFVPSHDLIQGDKDDTIIINLPGFKKEHIKVLVYKSGNKLKVSGERPVEENKWIRFGKDIEIPENCNVTEIRAKLNNNCVYITLPKFVVVPVPHPQDQTTQTNTEDKKATEPKLSSTDQTGHSQKANENEQREEKRSDPPPVDAQNKGEDDEADQSDKDLKRTSDAASEAESFKSAMSEPKDQRKLSMRLRTLKRKALKSAYGSRKIIYCAFAVFVISVIVGMIMLQLIEPSSGTCEGVST